MIVESLPKYLRSRFTSLMGRGWEYRLHRLDWSNLITPRVKAHGAWSSGSYQSI